MSAYGFLDTSSLLKNDFKQDTSTQDTIVDLQDDITTLKDEVDTLKDQVAQLINLLTQLSYPT